RLVESVLPQYRQKTTKRRRRLSVPRCENLSPTATQYRTAMASCVGRWTVPAHLQPYGRLLGADSPRRHSLPPKASGAPMEHTRLLRKTAPQGHSRRKTAYVGNPHRLPPASTPLRTRKTLR